MTFDILNIKSPEFLKNLKIDELNESRQILNLSDFNNSSEESEIEVKE